MLHVIRNILYTDTGQKPVFQKSPGSQSVIELIRDLVLMELKACIVQLRSVTGETPEKELFDLPQVMRFLSSNERSLQRFVRQLSFTNILQHDDIKNGVQSMPNSTKFAKSYSFTSSLEKLGWTPEKITELTSYQDDPVKLARRIRADKITQKMSTAAYKHYSDARAVYFSTKPDISYSNVIRNSQNKESVGSGRKDLPEIIKIGKKSSIDMMFCSLGIDKRQVSPFVTDVLTYFAAEIVHVVIDLVLVLRYDRKHGTHLRQDLLNAGETATDPNHLTDCLSGEFESVLSSADILEVRRIFCAEVELGGENNSDRQLRSILLLL